MTNLHDLPPEILDPILEYCQSPPTPYQSSCPQTTHLANLALASRSLLPFTRNHLYSSFWSIDPASTWRIRSFLCALISNPVLVFHVRHLNLRAWRAWHHERDEWDDVYQDFDAKPRRYSPAQNSRDRKLFHKAIRELRIVDKKTWKVAVRKDVDEVFVALLLLVAREVREVDLIVPCDPVFIVKALEHATSSAPTTPASSLAKLKRVSFTCRGNLSDIDIRHAVPLLSLLALESLSIAHVPTSYLIRPGEELRNIPLNRNLKTLRFLHARLASSDLTDLLGRCEALEMLHYQQAAVWRYQGFESPYTLQLADLGQALNGIGSTLQSLTLEIEGSTRGTLGSLRGCMQLRRLDMPLPLLYRGFTDPRASLADILPPSLQYWRIGIVKKKDVEEAPSELYTRMIQDVSKLVGRKPTGLPNLNVIEVRTFGGWSFPEREVPTEAAVQALREACTRAKVALLQPYEAVDFTRQMRDLRLTVEQ